MDTIKKMVNMKEKVIFYGWLCSIPCMMAGLGTVEWAIETGEGSILSGLLLFSSFIFFSCLLCRNTKEIEKEMEDFDRSFDNFLRNISHRLNKKIKHGNGSGRHPDNDKCS